MKLKCEACGQPATTKWDSQGEGFFYLCDKKTGDHGDDYYCGVLIERLSERPCYPRIENDMRNKCYSRSKEGCEFVGGKCAHCGKVFP